jgi:hypothetical protein
MAYAPAAKARRRVKRGLVGLIGWPCKAPILSSMLRKTYAGDSIPGMLSPSGPRRVSQALMAVQRRVGPASSCDELALIAVERAKHVLGRQSVDVIIFIH